MSGWIVRSFRDIVRSFRDLDTFSWDDEFHRMQKAYRDAARRWKEAARPGHQYPVGSHVTYHGRHYKIGAHAPGGNYHLDGPFGSRAFNVSPGDFEPERTSE